MVFTCDIIECNHPESEDFSWLRMKKWEPPEAVPGAPDGLALNPGCTTYCHVTLATV